jgi:hypothetical protein
MPLATVRDRDGRIAKNLTRDEIALTKKKSLA